MNLTRDRAGALLLLMLFVFYGFHSAGIALLPVQQTAALTARSLPYTYTVLGITGSLWLLVRPVNTQPLPLQGMRWWRLLAFLALMSLYGLALRPAGFLLASAALLAAGFYLLGERRWRWVVGAAAAIASALWGLLQYGLGVHLPGPAF